ncbi:MAG: glycosyltransferase family 4 protein [Patescibacteria group bacterium]|jgi:glycosyltransferase involved in cell wall biosynthesis
MRIAFIGQKGIPVKFGGIERHAEELAARLVKNGHQVFVYTRPWYSDPELKEFQGIKLISLPSINTKHLDAISHTFVATIHALFAPYDVIHYHGVGPALLSFIPRIFKPSARVVVTFHCIDRKHQKWGWFARLTLKLGEMAACAFAHKTIAVSKSLQFYCSQIYNCEAVYIPSGASWKPAVVADNLLAEKFGLDQDDYILTVSRLVRHKGIHYLIDGYRALKTDKKLVIVGDSAFTDDYVKELREAAKDDPRIIFTGYQGGAELEQLFAHAYLVVQPSESEGLPLSVLEAMSYSRAVLSSDIAENLEVVKDHGFSFKNKDVADLVSQLELLLSRPDLVKTVGSAGRDYINQNYNWDDIARKTGDVYKELLAEEASLEAVVIK